MRFDFIIGNPPYQDETIGENKTFAPPVYHLFLEEAYKISDCVEMVHPARFLFNAGNTPKEWNRKMLNDPHLKVLFYEQESSSIFNNTEIKGGIAITYRDKRKNYGAIGTFTAYPELNETIRKIWNNECQDCDSQEYKNGESDNRIPSMKNIVVSRTAYRMTEKMHKEHPEALSQLSDGHPYDMSTNIFERLPQIFFDKKPNDEFEYVQIIGREKNSRVYKYVRKDYIQTVESFSKYKLFLPSANGKGTLGEILTEPIICDPFIGATETFVSIGGFDTKHEAESVLKYIKTKFARVLLGVLKVTQHITPDKWSFVPLQDFTANSDIDWSKTIHEIDLQLYKKYGLSDTEITFIESHVKEMM